MSIVKLEVLEQLTPRLIDSKKWWESQHVPKYILIQKSEGNLNICLNVYWWFITGLDSHMLTFSYFASHAQAWRIMCFRHSNAHKVRKPLSYVMNCLSYRISTKKAPSFFVFNKRSFMDLKHHCGELFFSNIVCDCHRGSLKHFDPHIAYFYYWKPALPTEP